MTQPDAVPLYISEPDLAKLLGFSPERWDKIRPLYEKAGFPLCDALCGLRYYRAVLAFLDRHNGLARYAGSEPLISNEQLEDPDALRTHRANRRARPVGQAAP